MIQQNSIMWYNLYHAKFSFYQIQVQDTIQGLVYCITCIVPTGALEFKGKAPEPPTEDQRKNFLKPLSR